MCWFGGRGRAATGESTRNTARNMRAFETSSCTAYAAGSATASRCAVGDGYTPATLVQYVAGFRHAQKQLSAQQVVCSLIP